MRALVLVVGVLGVVACKSADKDSKKSAAPVLDPIALASVPSAVPKDPIIAINKAIQLSDAALPDIGNGDCAKATAAVEVIVANVKTIRAQDAELRKTFATLNDSNVNDWVKRSFDPIVNGRAFETGKQLASKGPASKCMSDQRFADALKSFGAAANGPTPQ